MAEAPKFDFGDEVQVTAGEHKGRVGWIVSINPSAPSETYTVEFSDGADAEIKEASLSKATSQ
jgi:ribosomal protein S4E